MVSKIRDDSCVRTAVLLAKFISLLNIVFFYVCMNG